MLSPAAPQKPAESNVNFLPSQTPMEGAPPTAVPASPITPDGSQAQGQDPNAPMEHVDDPKAIQEQLSAHLDQLPDTDKQFLAEHLTPEFVRAIGLINGPEVASYLNQFADPDKVLVPVPRKIAEQFLAEQQAQAAKQPQGAPQPAQAAPAMQPPQGTPAQAPVPIQPSAPPPQAAGPQGGMMMPRQ